VKDFRVKFRLPDDIAGIFENITDKPGYVSMAIEWYATYGKKINERLARIESMLTNVTGSNPVMRIEEVEENEIDSAFSDFVL
jgi:hypothetical protein